MAVSVQRILPLSVMGTCAQVCMLVWNAIPLFHATVPSIPSILCFLAAHQECMQFSGSASKWYDSRWPQQQKPAAQPMHKLCKCTAPQNEHNLLVTKPHDQATYYILLLAQSQHCRPPTHYPAPNATH